MPQSQTHYFEDLKLGMEAHLARTVTEADILSFAQVTGDHNPVHVDADYAAKTMFKERISHGMLTASYISAVFAMRMPGPGCIYVSQTLNFRRPVRIGDCIEARVAVMEMWPEKKRVRFECVCLNEDAKAVLEGEAILLVPGRETAP